MVERERLIDAASGILIGFQLTFARGKGGFGIEVGLG